jgi:hypothetical protein
MFFSMQCIWRVPWLVLLYVSFILSLVLYGALSAMGQLHSPVKNVPHERQLISVSGGTVSTWMRYGDTSNRVCRIIELRALPIPAENWNEVRKEIVECTDLGLVIVASGVLNGELLRDLKEAVGTSRVAVVIDDGCFAPGL